MAEIHILLFMFFVSLISATAIPSQGELVLFALLATDKISPDILLATATAGSACGSAGNWLLGRYITHFQNKKWFPVSKKYLKKAEDIFKKHGPYALFLSWIPFIGDPLTIAAGAARTDFFVFLPIVTLCKFGRYMLVYALYEGIF